MDILRTEPKGCTKRSCKSLIPPPEPYEKDYSTCKSCRARNAASKKKRKRTDAPAEGSHVRAASAVGGHDSDQSSGTNSGSGLGGNSGTDVTQARSPVVYANSRELFDMLRTAFKGKHVNFYGAYKLPEDSLVSDSERVRMTIHDVWTVTGYRFTVKDHPQIKAGYKTRMWCSQDAARKKKSKRSKLPGVKNRDTVGMHRYNCDSSLIVTCQKSDASNSTDRIISVNLQHHDDHVPYIDVKMTDVCPTLDTDGLNRSGENEELDEDEDSLIDTEPIVAAPGHEAFHERFSGHIATIRDFCDGLEYQLQFEDYRMLETVERDGASFLQLAHSCLGRERCVNLSRGTSPATWERETARAMFYRTRPSQRDIDS